MQTTSFLHFIRANVLLAFVMLLCSGSVQCMLLHKIVPAHSIRPLPAFPGAEGFGRYATGGRGGCAYTIVFDIFGIIILDKPSVVLHDGQTAVGPATSDCKIKLQNEINYKKQLLNSI